ncbi:unnamed protein product [Dovyalis caffra]|uniref:Uncharacterized protein n=1 Tax=Dovyalis caffra TaxID=77055 RepID=A0AAV1QTR3_9ROSI|nr:unnamed protein product [Dovyalis caffra]
MRTKSYDESSAQHSKQTEEQANSVTLVLISHTFGSRLLAFWLLASARLRIGCITSDNVANFGEDFTRTFNAVLWISDDGVPDLGGNCEKSTCFDDESVDALPKSNQVNEMEGGALLGFNRDMNYNANLYNDRVASMSPQSKLHDPDSSPYTP